MENMLMWPEKGGRYGSGAACTRMIRMSSSEVCEYSCTQGGSKIVVLMVEEKEIEI